ncbi:Hydrogenase isoenzymes formation protein HypE [Maioricimonas rarisocia]|uniref:Hydrogenase isoenzymes formation protein HypE n=1 Tax=Maioricimonas rarisocia TaxID=2528026 RepID=A0A517Z6P5_9PLAN|nr:hydrogenase expression/formation protein HypE [Maioricimonas rarisocia]QDU38104.1 Hydrogenase isoenzymes formation protein HypE [Maioricimonas rarisocia]
MTHSSWQLNCPVQLGGDEQRITLAHGEGARLTRRLIDDEIRSRFRSGPLDALPDAAHVDVTGNRIAVTTDSFVVSPLFFPGGDIGSLAVHGTVNDLAVSGATPRWITLSLILEEGLPLPALGRVLDSFAAAACECAVEVIAGDTKVVPRGAADGMFLNTTGIGTITGSPPAGPQTIESGDVLLVSGPIGRHGMAVLCAREELALEPAPRSDSAPLTGVVETLLRAADGNVRAIRDATRGGVSAVLHEWADACELSFRLQESRLPVSADVRGASELLGIDPLYVACEGTLVAAVAPGVADQVIESLCSRPDSSGAAVIGSATDRTICPVTIRRTLGREQPVDEPTGAMLPRIC